MPFTFNPFSGKLDAIKNIAGKANVELDNLASVAINTSLISDTDSTDDLGSSTKFWANAYTDKLYLYHDESNPAYLEREDFDGIKWISGRSEAASLNLLSQDSSIALGVKSGGNRYNLTIQANATYGITLDAAKAGGEGVIVLGAGTDLLPASDSSLDIGSSTLFFANVYTDLLHLSSTINIDGSETGVVKFTAADLRPDSDSTRDLGAADVTAKDQSEEGAGNQACGFRGAAWSGQSFISGSGVTNLSQVKLHLKTEGADEEIVVDIYLADGSDLPTGSILGTATIPAITNTSYEWKTFTFDPVASILASTKYCIVWSSPVSSSFYRAEANTNNPYANGMRLSSSDSGGSWSTVSGTDFIFQTFTESDYYWAETYTDKIFLNATATLDGATAGVINTVGKIGKSTQTTTLAVGVTTVAITADFLVLTGDGGGNTLATLTGGVSGQILNILFVDALVTITDTDAHTADAVDLSAAFTGADDTILTLIHDGTSWYEVSRSVN